MTTQTRSERHFHSQKEKRGRSWGGGGGLWQGGFSKFPSLEVSYRSLMQQVLNVVLCVFLSAHMLPNLRGEKSTYTVTVKTVKDTMFLPPAASLVIVFSFLDVLCHA